MGTVGQRRINLTFFLGLWVFAGTLERLDERSLKRQYRLRHQTRQVDSLLSLQRIVEQIVAQVCGNSRAAVLATMFSAQAREVYPGRA